MNGQIEVVTEQVIGASVRLSRVSGGLADGRDALGRTAGAAHGTKADGAYERACDAWAQAIHGYGLAADGLGLAVRAAAECYVAADRLPSAGER